MGVSKVVYGNEIVMDISGDSVTAADLSRGKTAHGADGESIVGTNPIKVVLSQLEYNTLSLAEKMNGNYYLIKRNIGDYVYLSFIQGNGVSYIDTGIKGDNTSEIEVEISSDESLRIGTVILGSRKAATEDSIYIGTMAGSPFQILSDFYNYNDSRATDSTSIVPNSKYKIITSASERKIYLGDTLRGENTNLILNVFETPGNIYLFDSSVNKAGATELFNGKIHSFKHKKNGVLVQNMVPVLRIRDLKYGMLDLVNDQFYSSANSTEFTGG